MRLHLRSHEGSCETLPRCPHRDFLILTPGRCLLPLGRSHSKLFPVYVPPAQWSIRRQKPFTGASVLHLPDLQLAPSHGEKWNMGSWHHFLSLAWTVIISGKCLLLSGLSKWVTLTSDYLTVKCLPNFRP